MTLISSGTGAGIDDSFLAIWEQEGMRKHSQIPEHEENDKPNPKIREQ